MTVDERFIEGLHLFNAGEYYDCHEVIEDLWLETPSEDPHRNLYKGVIQAAAAYYQYNRGILSGAIGLYRTAVMYLEPYSPIAMGLDVKGLLKELRAGFAQLDKWDGQGDPPAPPEEPKVFFSEEAEV